MTELGDTCQSDEDCQDGIFGGDGSNQAMVCRNQVCGCNDGFYERKSFDCRPKSVGKKNFSRLCFDIWPPYWKKYVLYIFFLCIEEGSCVINTDCPETLSCLNGICNITQPEIPEEPTDQIDETFNLLSNHDLLSKKPIETDDLPTNNNRIKSCTRQNDCKDIAHSFCVTKFQQCACEPGYTFVNDKCLIRK